MTLRAWWAWQQSLPLTRRWFVWLLLLRPLIDLSYELKTISPFLSPLYIVAALTPIAVVVSFCSRSFPRRAGAVPDVLIGGWGLLLCVNAVAGVAFGISATSLELAVRLTLPIFLYFYLRAFIQSKADLVGLLSTFLFSTVFVFGMLLYERLVSPLREVVVTRGFERFEGMFADVNSYAFYIAGALLVGGFFFLDDEGQVPMSRRLTRLTVLGALSTLALLSMHHAASWAVFSAIAILILFHTTGRNKAPAAVVLLVMCVPAYYLVGDEVYTRLNSMFERELAIIDGERDVEFAFHGRMQRWQRHWADWEEMSLGAKLFGMGIDTQPTASKVGGGIHNEYLRALFATGWIGLLLYFGSYVVIFMKTFMLPAAERFLIRGGMAMLMLYSVTSAPMTSMPLTYLGMCVLAFGANPFQSLRRAYPASRLERPPRRRRLTRDDVAGRAVSSAR